MKQIKTAESILRETHDNLSKPNPTDWKSFEEIMKDGTGEAMLNAMRAYAEQFINAAAEDLRSEIEELRKYRTHPERLTIRYDEALSKILKLKEHLK